jgi:hypothetical protein
MASSSVDVLALAGFGDRRLAAYNTAHPRSSGSVSRRPPRPMSSSITIAYLTLAAVGETLSFTHVGLATVYVGYVVLAASIAIILFAIDVKTACSRHTFANILATAAARVDDRRVSWLQLRSVHLSMLHAATRARPASVDEHELSLAQRRRRGGGGAWDDLMMNAI